SRLHGVFPGRGGVGRLTSVALIGGVGRILCGLREEQRESWEMADCADPKTVQDLTELVQNLLQQMQDKFQTMSDQIIGRIDEMSTRIDDLEKNIADLMTQAGVEEVDAANKVSATISIAHKSSHSNVPTTVTPYYYTRGDQVKAGLLILQV
ncbi:unnamed protein product, partial [Staurois parvus]